MATNLKNQTEPARAIKKHFESLKKEVEVVHANKGLFKIMTANQWLELAKKSPTPEMLFREFWHEGEICILFSDSNLGKSILGIQIADDVSKGHEAPKQKVLYFDFEHSPKQIEARYSVKNEALKTFENHYSFDTTNMLRVEINPDADPPTDLTFEDYLNESIEQSIIDTGAKILIIDNITYLKNETERSKDALPLMKGLKALKSKYGLSILALAHTPKRDLSRPITQNDLGGSKMLFNFVDSCFAIGQSTIDKSMRYIKQIKARNTQMIYDAENVLTCQITKPNNFLSFEFIGFSTEREHLKQMTEKDRESAIQQAKELSKSGYSQRQIAAELCISIGAVNKYLKM